MTKTKRGLYLTTERSAVLTALLDRPLSTRALYEEAKVPSWGVLDRMRDAALIEVIDKDGASAVWRITDKGRAMLKPKPKRQTKRVYDTPQWCYEDEDREVPWAAVVRGHERPEDERLSLMVKGGIYLVPVQTYARAIPRSTGGCVPEWSLDLKGKNKAWPATVYIAPKWWMGLQNTIANARYRTGHAETSEARAAWSSLHENSVGREAVFDAVCAAYKDGDMDVARELLAKLDAINPDNQK